MSSQNNICKKFFVKPLVSFLKLISVGKYSSVFYNKERNLHSSVIGGIITLILATFLIAYGGIILNSVINRVNYNLEINLNQLESMLFDQTKNVIDPDKIIQCNTKSCDRVTINDYL